MINTNTLCMECMKEKGDAAVCPHCGSREDGLQSAPYLPVRTWLIDRYLVGKVLHADGEGVTYIGWDNILQSTVTVREFLPEGLCGRVPDSAVLRPLSDKAEDYGKCLTAFLKLSRALARMRDLAALFPTYDIFELNGTAYAVSEYTESITLGEFLHRNGDSLTFEQTRTLMLPAVSTLSALHAADIIHGGISPETLYVGRDGRLRFSGFAGAELRTMRGALKTQLFPGYSAIEQYGFDGRIGPQTDVYAFAASIYRVIAGQAPMDAKVRVGNDLFVPAVGLSGKCPAYTVEAITAAMQLMPDARTATIERFREEFSAAPTVTEQRVEQHTPVREVAQTQTVQVKKSRGAVYTVVAMVVTLALLAGLFLLADWKWQLFGVIGNEPSSQAPSLLVISSEEAPSVTENTPPTRKMETFTGQTLTACERNYSSYSFKVLYRVYNEEYAKDVIISQTPEAGTPIPLESDEVQEVTVVVSLGSGQIKIPPVTGKTYAEALDDLWQAGFSRDSVSTNIEDPAYDGIVTRISPEAGNTQSVYEAKVMLYVENPTESDAQLDESTPNREVSSVDDTASKTTSR